MYNDILPAYNELREEVGLKPLRSPKCYFGNPDPNVIIMENLKLKDFVMRKSVEDGNNSFILRKGWISLTIIHM